MTLARILDALRRPERFRRALARRRARQSSWAFRVQDGMLHGYQPPGYA